MIKWFESSLNMTKKDAPQTSHMTRWGVRRMAKEMFLPTFLFAFISVSAGGAAGFLVSRYTVRASEEISVPEEPLSVVYTEAETQPERAEPEITGHRYVLGMYEGYVAAFNAQPKDEASEDVYSVKLLAALTATPVNTLPADERRRLEEGIKIYTEEQLAKVLQDYGS